MVTSIAGTNPLTLTEDSLVSTIANLIAFQTFTGTGNATAAKGKIHIDWAEEPTNNESFAKAEYLATLPKLLIANPDESPTFMFDLTAQPGTYNCNYDFLLRFIREVDIDEPKADEFRRMKNLVGDVINAFLSAASTPGNFQPTMLSELRPVVQPRYQEVRDIPILIWDWQCQKLIDEG